MIEFNLPFEAKPQGSKNAFRRGNRIVLVEASKDLKPHRQSVSMEIRRQALAQGWAQAQKDEPIFVLLEFGLTRPKTVRRRFHIVKPDLDKLIRFTLDAITQAGNIWIDDSQAVFIVASKQYAAQPFIKVVVDNERPC